MTTDTDTLNSHEQDDRQENVEAASAACEIEDKKGSFLLRWFAGVKGAREIGIFGATVALFIILSILSPRFLTTSNLLNVARQISLTAIMAAGMTYVFVSGELDLSVGSQYGFMGMVVAMLITNYGWNPWFALVFILFFGCGIGLSNGLITTKFTIPSFIVTLGMLSIFRGAALLLSNGWSITPNVTSSMFDATGGYLFNLIPVQIIWMIAILLISGWVLAKTKFGYHVYATGGNKTAARLSGINTDRVKIICFMILSGLTGLTGAMYVGWLQSANPLAGTGTEMDVIAAVIIGGASLSGGNGTIIGTFLGAAITGMITNGLVLLGVSAFWEPVAKGAIIVGAVLLDTVIRRNRA